MKLQGFGMLPYFESTRENLADGQKCAGAPGQFSRFVCFNAMQLICQHDRET